jgi:hypothetical protein
MTEHDCGCKGDEFAALADVDETSTTTEPDPRGTTVTRWRSLIAPYPPAKTGDKRRFAPGALTNRDLPLPVKWQRTDAGGHSTSVVVATMDRVEYADEGVYGEGLLLNPDASKLPRLAEDVGEARLLVEKKAIGPSVDLDDMEFRTLEEEGEFADDSPEGAGRPEIEVTKGRISAITLVQIPAFAEVHGMELTEVDADEYAASLTASGAVVDRWACMEVEERPNWSPEAFLRRLRVPGEQQAALLASAFVYDDGETRAFPVADLVDGRLALVPQAVARSIAVLAELGHRVAVPASEMSAVRGTLTRLAARCGVEAPPWAEPEPDALVAAGAPSVVQRSAFDPPGFTGPTPLTVDGDRVYGHLALWNTCHTGFPGACTTAPRSPSSYAYFHTGEIQTTEGPLPVGKITIGGGHARSELGFQAALEHYDDAGTAVAVVRAGEDAHGIWVNGVRLAGADPDKFAALPMYPLSGDWRRIGGRLEMVAALAVNTPGFPVPRARVASGAQLSLVAAGVVDPEFALPTVDPTTGMPRKRRKKGRPGQPARTSTYAPYEEDQNPLDALLEELGEFGDLSREARMAAARKKQALPTGAFPIRNVGELEDAVQAYGRAKESDRAAVRRLIMRRARELHREDLIPDAWKGKAAAALEPEDQAHARAVAATFVMNTAASQTLAVQQRAYAAARLLTTGGVNGLRM